MNKLILLILCIANMSCNLGPKTGVKQSCDSIDQSQKLGVFIAEYHSIKPNIVLDSTEFKINEIWLEKDWEFLNSSGDIFKYDMNKSLYISVFGNLSDIEYVPFIQKQYSIGYKDNKIAVWITTDGEGYSDTIKIDFQADQLLTLVKK